MSCKTSLTIWSVMLVHIYVSTARKQYRCKLDNLGEHLPFIHRERGGGGGARWNVPRVT